MKYIHVVSFSSGKDSQATLLLAIEQCGKENVRAVIADTDNEDPAVFEHCKYIEQELGIKIIILKADFTAQIKHRRQFIANDRRVKKRRQTKYNPDGSVLSRKVMRVRWTNKQKRRALKHLHVSGNPYLDLCMWKGRFPGRRAQFCTQELKTMPLVEYQMGLVDQGYGVISWQGVRRDESHARKDAKLMQRIGKRMWAFRPIIHWDAQKTVNYSTDRGLKVNPLYSMGFDRVGCMPCINCGKGEINNIGARRPEELKRIEAWEKQVGLCSKPSESSFFPTPNREAHLNRRGIWNVVEWAKTTRGGKQFDLLQETESPVCSSSYGLCDQPAKADA